MTTNADKMKIFVIHQDEMTTTATASYKINRKHCFSQGHTTAEKCHKNLHLKKINLVFNWRIIALQNFVVFCKTSARISHRYTRVPSLPSPSPSRPSRLSQFESVFEFPESYRKFPLAVYFIYGIVRFHFILSIHLTSSPFPMSRSVVYVCFSTAAMKINS